MSAGKKQTRRKTHREVAAQAVELTGAVALMDALGFRNFRQKRTSTQVLRTLETIKQTYEVEAARHEEIAQEISKRFPNDAWNPTYRAFFFSDTIAFVAAAAPGKNATSVQGFLLSTLVWGIAKAIRIASEARHGLSYRGAVACGDVALSASFAIGSAVDEAAAVMEQADAAIVWLAPSALSVASRPEPLSPIDLVHRGGLVEWTIPLRDGRTFATQAVNPFFGNALGTDASLHTQLLKTFEGSTDLAVRIKQQKTNAFLQFAREELRRLKELESRAKLDVITRGAKDGRA